MTFDPRHLPDTRARTDKTESDCDTLGLTAGTEEYRFCREVIAGNKDLRFDAWQRNQINNNISWYREGGQMPSYVYNMTDRQDDENLRWWLSFAANANKAKNTTYDDPPVDADGVAHAYAYVKRRDPGWAAKINADFLGMPDVIGSGSSAKWGGPQYWLFKPRVKPSGHKESGVKAIVKEAQTFSQFNPETGESYNEFDQMKSGVVTEIPGVDAAPSGEGTFFSNLGDDMESMVWVAGGIGILVLGYWMIS